MTLPSRAVILKVGGLITACLAVAVARPLGAPAPAGAQGGTMTVDQVMKMPKIDAHAHLGALGPEDLTAFVAFLDRYNLRWLNVCVGGMNWARLQNQIDSAKTMHRAHPERIAWATSFNLTNWGDADWAKAATDTIAAGFAGGAVAVKVWKDIGMVLKDPDGRYVMIDDPRMDPVLDAVASGGRTLVAHIGEPRNCWLPLDKMTTASDRGYFAAHPEYHGLLHPEVPDYARQIAARDRMLERHPKLRVVGCHLGSLEYDVDELAKRLDRYPNLAVDLAARLVHLQIQPRDKVRAFLLKYQDRILYGTDMEFGRGTGAAADDRAKALERLASDYVSDATWLATDQEVAVDRARAGFTSRGVALPEQVLRKLYFENARAWYPGI
jgi:predicted TIM-barrel fold metal-dependent hydrolase